MKKFISGVLVLSMLTDSAVIVSAKTREELSGYSLLYENTFDNGAAEAMSGENFEFTTPSAPSKATYNGNNGIVKTGGVLNDPTLEFDFTQSLTTGVYKVGFDFNVSGEGSYRNSVIAVNRKDGQWLAVDMMHIVENMYSIKETIDSNGYMYDWPATGTALDTEVHRVEIVMEPEMAVANYYVDGVFVQKQTNFPTSVDNLVFYLQGDIKYFDNLKLEKFDTLVMSASVTEKDDSLYVDFTDGIENKSVFAESLKIKNLYTGEEISATAEVVSDFSVKLTPETALTVGMEYMLILPESLSGRTGGVIDENPLFNLAYENAISTVDLLDISGNTYKISDKNPSEIDSFKIEFTEDVAADDAIAGLTLKNKKDQTELSYESECNGNVAVISLISMMTGNQEYILSLPYFGTLYEEISIKTGEGKIVMYAPVLTDADGNEISEIPSGDFALKLQFINTSEENESYEASVTLFDGKKMADIKTAEIFALSGEKKTVTLNFSADGLENPSVRGLILNSDATVADFDLISFPNYAKPEVDVALGEITQTGDCGVIMRGEALDLMYLDVFLDGKSCDDIAEENIKDILIYRDYARVDEDGEYTFDFELTKTGDYDVYINDTEKVSEKIDFAFVNNADYAALAENIADMDEEEIKKILDGSHDKYQKTLLGISDVDAYGLNLEELAEVIKNTIADEPVTSDRDASWAIIDRAVFVQKLNDEKIKNIYEEDKNQTQLSESEISEWYEKEYVGEALRENFTARLSAKGFESYKEYKDAILPAFVLATVKEPNGSGNVEDILKEFEEEIDIDIKSDTKSKVWTKLSGKDFASLSELEEAYEEAVKVSESAGSGGSGGGGSKKPSSGVSGTVTMQPVLNNELQNVIPGEGVAVSFSDIDSVAWAKEAIEVLASRGIINGIGNNLFNPDGYITREQFVKIAVGAFVPDAAMANPEFSDVISGAWYEDFIRKAYAKGIANGMGNGKFGVGENITRQDMCVMIYNAAIAAGMTFETTKDDEFEDDYLISDYAKEAVYALKNAGAVSGVNDFEFEPQGNATRAQAAKIIYCLIK